MVNNPFYEYRDSKMVSQASVGECVIVPGQIDAQTAYHFVGTVKFGPRSRFSGLLYDGRLVEKLLMARRTYIL